MPPTDRYRPIGDYALIGDCHSAALVSRGLSIDWCCMPRFDSGSTFGRLLDPERGGHCTIRPLGRGRWSIAREYLEDTLVLCTRLQGAGGEASVTDLLVAPYDDAPRWRRRLLRRIAVSRGTIGFELRVQPRFDYGDVRPWIRRHGHHVHSATGGDDGLVIVTQAELEESPVHELSGRIELSAGQRAHLCLDYLPPELIGDDPPAPDPDALDGELERTAQWWREWCQTLSLSEPHQRGARRSAITLKGLTYRPTGAIVAAPTTSLPEVAGGVRNWDYRYAWIRDSSFSSRAFAEVGCEHEADSFRAFVLRSSAGHVEDLQIMYGIGGERRLGVQELELAGYRAARPVRVGNSAAGQRQLDSLGELVNLSYRWHERGHSPDDDEWRFLVSLVDRAAEAWQLPDQGLWEWPGKPDHFVHSKALCWAALERGLLLAEQCMRQAPVRRWRRARDACRAAIERQGVDHRRGCFVQAFGRRQMDAGLLLLPTVNFVDWRDERMIATVQAVRDELGAGDGLLYRYRRKDGLPGQEGAFLCTSFWLVECLARQGELDDARTVYDAAVACGNDLGLFSEEVDPRDRALLGNYPQGLTHLAHISATVALDEAQERVFTP